jgi:hypothetical protein
MFTAIVLACVLNAPDACIEATDTYGPYQTIQECEARLEEMIPNVVSLLPAAPFELSAKCDKKGMPL